MMRIGGHGRWGGVMGEVVMGLGNDGSGGVRSRSDEVGLTFYSVQIALFTCSDIHCLFFS